MNVEHRERNGERRRLSFLVCAFYFTVCVCVFVCFEEAEAR